METLYSFLLLVVKYDAAQTPVWPMSVRTEHNVIQENGLIWKVFVMEWYKAIPV